MDRKEILFGLAAAIFLALVLSPFASPWPDGLEKVAQDKGFLGREANTRLFSSPVRDYTWPGIKNEKLSTSFAGIFGTLLVFGMGYGMAVLIRKKKDHIQ